jgi:hypothetical protein
MRTPNAFWMALTIGASLLNGTVHAQEKPEAKRTEAQIEKAHHTKVIVLIPEQHLARPRIPDPAAETGMCKQLIEAGYKVIDQQRVTELRYQGVIDRIMKGDAKGMKEAVELGRRFGADVLITGEAFTQQEGEIQRIVTDLGPVNRVQCRARIELMAIRMDTAEKFFADSIHQTGAPEATIELASKGCLQGAAEDLSAKVIKKLDGIAISDKLRIDLEVRGIGSASLAQALEQALEQITGVLAVSPGDYAAHNETIELTLKGDTAKGFAGKLETEPSLKRFHITVESYNRNKIVVTCK